MASVLLEARPYRPFKSSEEYLEAMREDLAEWLNIMYPELLINSDNFMDRLDTGVALCKHANNVRQAAEDYLARRQARNKSMTRSMTSGLAGPILALGNVHYLPAAKSGTFFARDNVSNFITWCRKSLKIFECLLFETDDLIMRKNEKHVILCLLEVARRGAKFGMLAPMLVQMERQIDREIAADNKANGIGCGTQTDFNGTNTISTGTEFDTDTEDEDDEGPMLMYGPQPQIITNDLKSLDEMVRDLVEKCTCPSQFPMVRVSEGKYRIGDTKVLIFVRILRSHVMVRVGGGWDTLSHYLDKHDPCRCRAQHRSAVGARLIPRTNAHTNGIELHRAQVIYERSPPPARKMASLNGGGLNNTLLTSSTGRSRSRSPTPQRKFLNSIAANQTIIGDNTNNHDKQQSIQQHQGIICSPNLVRRSMSPSPRRLVEFRKKQTSLDSTTIPTNSNNHVPLSVHFDTETKLEMNSTLGNGTLNVDGGSNKFENISDNGSEISDEGYRSLGVIQPGSNNNTNNNPGSKRESLHSQTSVEDADCNMHPDQNSSDSQISPTEDQSSSKTAENLESNSSDVIDSIMTTSTTTPPSPPPPSLTSSQQQGTPNGFSTRTTSPDATSNNFEQSGIFITDYDITVDIASATGLRKTGFSDNLYGDDGISPIKKGHSKIPRSPVPTRRRSVDNMSECGSDLTQRTGLPIFNRKQPVYRSVRTPSNKTNESVKGKPLNKEATNTWNGRTSTPKKRASITSDTFTQPQSQTSSPIQTGTGFNRNSKGRSSQILYDSNGRRVRGSTSSLTTSPIKNNSHSTSPLAQQLLEAAGNAKNDAQILEKMKQLLTKYSSGNGKGKKADYDDFTTAWVHSNGNLDRASSCSPPIKEPSKRSSAASSTESTHSKDISVILSPRRDRGLSRIPAPVRNNTELY